MIKRGKTTVLNLTTTCIWLEQKEKYQQVDVHLSNLDVFVIISKR